MNRLRTTARTFPIFHSLEDDWEQQSDLEIDTQLHLEADMDCVLPNRCDFGNLTLENFNVLEPWGANSAKRLAESFRYSASRHVLIERSVLESLRARIDALEAAADANKILSGLEVLPSKLTSAANTVSGIATRIFGPVEVGLAKCENAETGWQICISVKHGVENRGMKMGEWFSSLAAECKELVPGDVSLAINPE